MAIKLAGKDETIKVIARVDDAVNCSDAEYDEYLAFLDESILSIKGNPTRFVVRKVMPYAASKDLEAGRLKINQETREISVSAMQLEEARAVLVGIENPADCDSPIEFKKDSDGLASRELIASLATAGIIANLIAARGNSNVKTNPEVVKKK